MAACLTEGHIEAPSAGTSMTSAGFPEATLLDFLGVAVEGNKPSPSWGLRRLSGLRIDFSSASLEG